MLLDHSDESCPLPPGVAQVLRGDRIIIASGFDPALHIVDFWTRTVSDFTIPGHLPGSRH